MLKVTGLDHLNMNVKDIEITTEFYTKYFGFKVVEDAISHKGNPFRIIGVPGKIYLALYRSDNPQLTSQSGHINHFGFHIEDFPKALNYIKENQIELGYGSGITDHQNSKSIYIVDPNGYEIELSEKFGAHLGL